MCRTVIEKQLPDSESRESPTLRLGGSGSCQLSDSASQGVADSPTQQFGESTTCQVEESAIECLKENSESRPLPNSPSWGVANFPTRRVGESLWCVWGSHY
jgi:hypothetical protein